MENEEIENCIECGAATEDDNQFCSIKCYENNQI